MDTGIAFLLVASMLVVGLKIYSSYKRSGQRYPIPSAAILEWFELQICPYDFRFALVPHQPLLIGLENGNGDNLLLLLSREDYPDEIRSTLSSLDSLIKRSRVLEIEPNDPEAAFEGSIMNTPSLHLRIGYGMDGYATAHRWQTCYDIAEIPDRFLGFVEECRIIALGLVKDSPSREASEKEVWEMLRVRRTVDQLSNPPGTVIARIVITREGDIILDRKVVTLDELEMRLKRVKNEGGIVWYHREHPPNAPSESVIAQIEAVIEVINELGLYAELCEQDFG